MSRSESQGSEPDWSAIQQRLEAVLTSDSEGSVPVPLLQVMFTLAVREYSRQYENDPSLPPMLREKVTATDVANSVLEMLRVVDLELFELTLWGSRIAKEPVAGQLGATTQGGNA